VQLGPEVSCDSGLLHVLCFRQRSRSDWVWQGARGLFGAMRAGPRLLVRETRQLRVHGVAPVQIDGDHGGSSPVTIDLLPECARIFAPR
jgi:diacylglycerol kinase family enzyme